MAHLAGLERIREPRLAFPRRQVRRAHAAPLQPHTHFVRRRLWYSNLLHLDPPRLDDDSRAHRVDCGLRIADCGLKSAWVRRVLADDWCGSDAHTGATSKLRAATSAASSE